MAANVISFFQPGRVDAPLESEANIGTLAALSIYCAVLGKIVNEAELAAALKITAGEEITTAQICAALDHVGFLTDLQRTKSFTPEIWPACVRMRDGSYIVVLSQGDDRIYYVNRSAPNGFSDMELEEFQTYATAWVLKAEPKTEELSRRHIGPEVEGHWFWGALAKQRRLISEVALGSLVSSFLAVAVSLFALQVYDRVIPHESQSTLWVLVLGVSLAIVLEAMLKMARSRLMDAAGRDIEITVSSLLFSRLLGMRIDQRPQGPSALIYSVREFGAVREFFTATSVGTVADIPFVVVFLGMIYLIAGPIVWILVAAAVLMVLPSLLLQKKMARLSREMLGGSSAQNRVLNDAVFGQETLKTMQGEGRLQRSWDEISTLNAIKTTEQRSLAASLTMWAASVQQLAYISTVVAGCYMVFANEFTVGTIIATGLLTSRTLAPITQLSGAMVRWSNVKTALNALDSIIYSSQERPQDKSYLRRRALQGAYEIAGLRYGYSENGPAAVAIDNLKIGAHESVALLGMNGSGKSTLLRLLAGIYQPHAGTILIDNLDSRQIDPQDLRQSIGYLPQDVKLFTGTLRDNLKVGPYLWEDERLMEALEFAGLGAFVRGHAQGLDLMIKDGGDGLSSGQRQSVGWARLYLQNPMVLLLDEPTAAMDQTLETALIQRLSTWMRGRTTIVATHRVPILQLTDRTIIMQDGQLRIDGPRDQVIRQLQEVQQQRAAATGPAGT